MRVIGSRRNPANTTPYVDQLYAPHEIDQLLSAAQFLVLATPHTPETDGLIGEQQLALLPKGAVLINIARGQVIDQNALIASLQSGHLHGAALDVTTPEPLPPDSPLWGMPNVIISPHSASTADTENAKITALFCDNLKRYLNGEPLLNVLDVEKMY